MKRKKSLRFRLSISYLLILIPIIVFVTSIYLFVQSSGQQHIDRITLQNFNYAAENISNIFGQIDYAAQTAFNVENAISLDENGEVLVPSDEFLCAALSSLESRIIPNVSAFFYIKSDSNIFIPEGKMLYSSYEHQVETGYELSSSALYSKLQTVSSPSIVPLVSSEDFSKIVGLAYLIPFPTNINSNAILGFVLPNNVILEEFQNYMGDLTGDLYIYDGRYELLYASSQQYLSPSQAMRLRGTGILNTASADGGRLVALRASVSERSLNIVMLVPYNDFYASSINSQHLLAVLILLLFILLFFLVATNIFYNYKPIKDLANYISGGKVSSQYENELDIILDRYNQAVNEINDLSTSLDEITPLITQQFVRKLIFGRISDEQDLAIISNRADVHLTQQWSFVLYLSFFRQETDTAFEKAYITATLFSPEDASVIVGELTAESALCLIINFDAHPDCLIPTTENYAHQLYDHMLEYGAAPEAIGIGSPYDTPLKMNESFAEAVSAVQLMPASHTIWRYYTYIYFQVLSQNALFLLGEGIKRGDKATALRAFNTIVEDISTEAPSLFFFRFYCADLLAAILRQIESMNLYLPKERGPPAPVLQFSVRNLLKRPACFWEDLCSMVEERLSQENEQHKDELF